MGKSDAHISDNDFGHKRGVGGCAILWTKTISLVTKHIDIKDTDRICAIQVKLNESCAICIICEM